MSARTVPMFSLIVATYGRAEVLAPLVASLGIQAYRSFEVIVADQNSDDRVLPVIEPLRAGGQLGAHLRLPEPNLSAARNAGLAVARGQYVVFPDDDCWYEPDTLAEAAACLEASPELDGLAARWAESPLEPGDLAPGPISPNAIRMFRGGNVASITLILQRDAVLSVGGFDERIGVGRWYGSGEETDLVLAMIARGYHIAHAPNVIVHHAVADGLRRDTRFHQERARARGTGALYAKHRLPAWVIARGLFAPLLALPGPDLTAGAARSLGRLEGMVRWHLAEQQPRRALASSGLQAETKRGDKP
jgi:glycosyltransferase involved in cell wall biosynthesis